MYKCEDEGNGTISYRGEILNGAEMKTQGKLGKQELEKERILRPKIGVKDGTESKHISFIYTFN